MNINVKAEKCSSWSYCSCGILWPSLLPDVLQWQGQKCGGHTCLMKCNIKFCIFLWQWWNFSKHTTVVTSFSSS